MDASEGGDDGKWREEWGSDQPLEAGFVLVEHKLRAENSNACILVHVLHLLLTVSFAKCRAARLPDFTTVFGGSRNLITDKRRGSDSQKKKISKEKSKAESTTAHKPLSPVID